MPFYRLTTGSESFREMSQFHGNPVPQICRWPWQDEDRTETVLYLQKNALSASSLMVVYLAVNKQAKNERHFAIRRLLFNSLRSAFPIQLTTGFSILI